MTSGLGEFGVDVPEPETQPDESDHDTSEDYKFSRPQCRALTADGDRCSNPVRRTEGNPEFCPRHHDTDCETIDDALETDGGTTIASNQIHRPTCPVCESPENVHEAPDAGYWTCFECGERGSGSAENVNWWRNDPDSQWYVDPEGGDRQ